MAIKKVSKQQTSLFCSHTYQLTYTILIEHLERVYFQNLLFQINRKEGSDIVTRISEGHLSQVIRSE